MKLRTHAQLARYELANRKRHKKALRRSAHIFSFDPATIEALDRRRAIALKNKIHFDRNLSRYQIEVPETFSFAENYEKTVEVLHEVRTFALKMQKPVMIHFENLKHIEAAAALALVAELYRCQRLVQIPMKKTIIFGVHARSREVNYQLEEMGFYKLLGISDPEKRPELDESKPIFLHFHKGQKMDGAAIARFVDIIINYNVLRLNPVAGNRLREAIGEAMTNAIDHAYSKKTQLPTINETWFLTASVNLLTHEVSVILYDQGIGIPQTLDINKFEKLDAEKVGKWLKQLFAGRNEGLIIKAATEIYRTRTDNQSRGRGLKQMKDFVDICEEGNLTVLSNRGYYHYNDLQETFGENEKSLGGTLIEWRVRNNQEVHLSDE